jgi:hypothetical protein
MFWCLLHRALDDAPSAAVDDTGAARTMVQDGTPDLAGVAAAALAGLSVVGLEPAGVADVGQP